MSHYAWLDANLQNFFDRILEKKYSEGVRGLITTHGDKCDCYRARWAEHNIPYNHGVALYLLGRIAPYCDEVRDTRDGWVDPGKWVVDNYAKFRPFLEYS